MTTTYSRDGDVSENLSNVTMPVDMVIDNFRVEAYNHINAGLRSLYTVPVTSTDAIDVSILRSVEAKRTAGRILMAVATIHEVENVSEYAKELLSEAKIELDALRNEEITLSSEAERDTDDSDEVIDPPRILGQAPDAEQTFGRPMSGIENDAIEGVVDSKPYNSQEDNKSV